MYNKFSTPSGVKDSSALLTTGNVVSRDMLSADSECINPLIDESHRLAIYIHDDTLLRRVELVAAICAKPAHVVNGIYLLLRERGIDTAVLLSEDFINALLPYLGFRTSMKSLQNAFHSRENLFRGR